MYIYCDIGKINIKKIYLSGYLLNICVCMFVYNMEPTYGRKHFLENLYQVQKFMAICWSNRYHLNTQKKHTQEQKKRIISIKLFYKNRSILSNNIFCFSFNLNSFKLKTISTSKATNNNNKNNSINNRKKQSISLRFNLIKYKINFASCS